NVAAVGNWRSIFAPRISNRSCPDYIHWELDVSSGVECGRIGLHRDGGRQRGVAAHRGSPHACEFTRTQRAIKYGDFINRAGEKVGGIIENPVPADPEWEYRASIVSGSGGVVGFVYGIRS